MSKHEDSNRAPAFRVIREVEVLHPVAFNAGPRVTKQQFIEVAGAQFRVDFWTDANGRVVRVDSPVPVAA